MLRYVFFLLTVSMLFIACGSSEENEEGWGIDEPYIQTEDETILFSTYSHPEIMVNDYLVFNKSYEEKDIDLTINSSCEDFTQQHQMKIKTKISILSILPYQVFLSDYSSKQNTMGCLFQFVAKNKKGDKHSFQLNSLEVNFSGLNKILRPLNIYDERKNLISISQSGANTVLPQVDKLYLLDQPWPGDYYLVCEDLLKKISDEEKIVNLQILSKKAETTICKILYITNQNNIYASDLFSLANRNEDLKIEVLSIVTHEHIYKLGDQIKAFNISIKNESLEKKLLLFDRKKAQAVLRLHKFLSKKTKITKLPVRFVDVWFYSGAKLDPLLKLKGEQLELSNQMNKLLIEPGEELIINLSYKLKDQMSYRDPCSPYNPYATVQGYSVTFPQMLSFFEVNPDVTLNELNDSENIINKFNISIQSHVLSYNFGTYADSCTTLM